MAQFSLLIGVKYTQRNCISLFAYSNYVPYSAVVLETFKNLVLKTLVFVFKVIIDTYLMYFKFCTFNINNTKLFLN